MPSPNLGGESIKSLHRLPELESASADEALQRLSDEAEFGPLYESEPSQIDRLGIELADGGCKFAVRTGSAEVVDLCLIDQEDSSKTTERWRLLPDETSSGLFSGFIPGMKAGDMYGLRVHGPWDPSNHKTFNYSKMLVDPYARAITGSFAAATEGHVVSAIGEHVDYHGNYLGASHEDSAQYIPKSVVTDEHYDWSGETRPNIPKEKMVIYEGHVKGLTQLHPDIPQSERGTYSGIASPQFIAHLKRLGITSLELLPVQHYVSEPHLQAKNLTNYWGYNTLGFFAPHEQYSANKQPGAQVREFKDMVKSLHNAGIEVILDVVYNHTPEGSEQGPTLSFKGLDAEQMYMFGGDGKHVNYSGCGNTFQASTEAGSELIMDSLRYWVQEMHVDGFRFDLATVLAREGPYSGINTQGEFIRRLISDPVLKNVKLIAEPWDCAGYAVGGFKDPWMEWNDKFRDVMRDFWRGNGDIGDLADKLAGSYSVARTVNFITAHDGFTMNDLVSYSAKHNQANGENGNDGTNDNRSFNFGIEGPSDDPDVRTWRQRAMRSMILSMFISAGTPMLSHGDEIMRTQSGNNNAYCQDNETTWMNWNLTEEQAEFLDYVAKIIHFRQNHPIFGRVSNFSGEPLEGFGSEADIAWFRPDGYELARQDERWHQKKVIGMYLSSLALGKTVEVYGVNDRPSLLYYANGTFEDKVVRLPVFSPYADSYELVIDTATGEVANDGSGQSFSEQITVRALSSVVLQRRSNGYA